MHGARFCMGTPGDPVNPWDSIMGIGHARAAWGLLEVREAYFSPGLNEDDLCWGSGQCLLTPGSSPVPLKLTNITMLSPVSIRSSWELWEACPRMVPVALCIRELRLLLHPFLEYSTWYTLEYRWAAILNWHGGGKLKRHQSLVYAKAPTNDSTSGNLLVTFPSVDTAIGKSVPPDPGKGTFLYVSVDNEKEFSFRTIKHC